MKFTKMSGAGNDFVLVERSLLPPRARTRLNLLARRLCDRRRSIGGDGLLVLERGRADMPASVDYFNADGSRAFCGNGSRCAAWWMHSKGWTRGNPFSFRTIEGILEAKVIGKERVRVRMPDARDARLGLNLTAAGRRWTVHAVDVGVPHAVIVIKDIERAPVLDAGRAIRHHRAFAPAGTNVDFISVETPARGRHAQIRIRTYERGVESETLACGSGAAAAAVVAQRLKGFRSPIRVRSRGGDVLTVRFHAAAEGFDDIWLEGPAATAFEGEVDL